jgi:nicotinamide phosphoribosyltransferase
MKQFPTGILSIVSDTWNLWDVITKYLPQLKEEILARDGKIVIRPDSGDPVDIVCGTDLSGKKFKPNSPEAKGVIELLWDTFGGTTNEQGYKVLDPHIGAIYGDSITLDRAEAICKRLETKGFASTNVVLGIGSFTYQYNTRDTYGFAMKATYVEIQGKGQEIFKDPITDDGGKKSAKGLLSVDIDATGNYYLIDQADWTEEESGELKIIFEDGAFQNYTTLTEIRDKLSKITSMDTVEDITGSFI